MKATIYTMIALFAMNSGMLFAGNYNSASPAFAMFSDGIEFRIAPRAFTDKLAPSIPKEADFEDFIPIIPINIEKLSPSTPVESDFEDTDTTTMAISTALVPVTPVEADFME